MGAEDEERETRCYAVTGEPSVLDGVERLLRRVEWIGEKRATRLVSALVEGRGGARITVRVLATWCDPSSEATEAGTLLLRLEDEESVRAIYRVDIVSR